MLEPCLLKPCFYVDGVRRKDGVQRGSRVCVSGEEAQNVRKALSLSLCMFAVPGLNKSKPTGSETSPPTQTADFRCSLKTPPIPSRWLLLSPHSTDSFSPCIASRHDTTMRCRQQGIGNKLLHLDDVFKNDVKNTHADAKCRSPGGAYIYIYIYIYIHTHTYTCIYIYI